MAWVRSSGRPVESDRVSGNVAGKSDGTDILRYRNIYAHEMTKKRWLKERQRRTKGRNGIERWEKGKMCGRLENEQTHTREGRSDGIRRIDVGTMLPIDRCTHSTTTHCIFQSLLGYIYAETFRPSSATDIWKDLVSRTTPPPLRTHTQH